MSENNEAFIKMIKGLKRLNNAANQWKKDADGTIQEDFKPFPPEPPKEESKFLAFFKWLLGFRKGKK